MYLCFWISDSFCTDCGYSCTNPHHNISMINEFWILIESFKYHSLVSKMFAHHVQQIWISSGWNASIGSFVQMIKHNRSSTFQKQSFVFLELQINHLFDLNIKTWASSDSGIISNLNSNLSSALFKMYPFTIIINC